MSVAPTTVEGMVEAIRTLANPVPTGGGTKPGMMAPGDPILSTGLSGIIEYEPSEYTFTAYAGTTLLDIEPALQEHGQYLPFEPPLVEAGATLGGMIAAGLNGPGAFRFGGLRDFILGVRFLTADGRLLRAGGKVVKNAAGFDVPKFHVGSQGRWGMLVEATFKVFPRPPISKTLRAVFASIDAALAKVCQWTRAPWEIDALEIDVAPARVTARLRGDEASLPGRIARFGSECELLQDAVAQAYWRAAREFAWTSPEAALVKVPTLPGEIAQLDASLGDATARRYSCGGHLAWISGPPEKMGEISRPAAVVRGEVPPRERESPAIERALAAAFGAAEIPR